MGHTKFDSDPSTLSAELSLIQKSGLGIGMPRPQDCDQKKNRSNH